MNNKLLNNGFTLVELMVIVIIIGILSAIAIPSYRTYTEKANLADASTILTNASQKISEQRLKRFNGSLVQNDLSGIVAQQVGSGSNKYSFGVKCKSDDDCSTYYLYAEPQNSSLKKSVWLGSNIGIYICDMRSVSSISDASNNNKCTKG
ncbi:type IV pilin protein [Snodgrassella sp.]|uniref:type IV pilin protein n=1 Tax=Snodgrassella sp. TaxID=2815304 RepID=UPI00258A3676|nr:type IV pilin protein [Snodgrassella sp.]MCO6525481.1 prepilin-type N-terminal cleavage/methylation domain-containing protein [Snodgrassella sp.]